MLDQRLAGLFRLLLLPGALAQSIDWLELVGDTARSSVLNTVPGSTLEREYDAEY